VRQDDSEPEGGIGMGSVERSIEVRVPVSTAYNQWTQFESFPRFMEGVDRVDQISPTTTHWVTSVGGVHRQFDAEIIEQRPDERIAWTTVSGPKQAGLVSFHRVDATTSRIILQMDVLPDGVLETLGDKLGLVGHRIEGDLKRFKAFIESRGAEEGGWRGTVDRPATP
jgi:uncharacterized membrane protein